MADQAVINEMNATIAAIQTLQTTVTGLPAAIQVAVQPAPPAVGPFIRTPFRANIANVFDRLLLQQGTSKSIQGDD